MYSLIASIIFSVVSIYVAFLCVIYGFYPNARTKIEETCKVFRGTIYKEIPTEEQVKIIEEELLKWKEHAESANDMARKKRGYYFEINVERYKLITRILNIMTFGRFKHFV